MKMLTPAVNDAVNRMNNYERTRWTAAHMPGATDKTPEVVDEYRAGLASRFERGNFVLASTGRLSMAKILQGRTGIEIKRIDATSVVVSASERMISRLVERFGHCLTAAPQSPSLGFYR